MMLADIIFVIVHGAQKIVRFSGHRKMSVPVFRVLCPMKKPESSLILHLDDTALWPAI